MRYNKYVVVMVKIIKYDCKSTILEGVISDNMHEDDLL